MKWMMVMIICFAEDACQALFDPTEFISYEQCITTAIPVRNYMRDLYVNSSGEIHCLTSEQIQQYRQFIDNGGKVELSLQHPENQEAEI